MVWQMPGDAQRRQKRSSWPRRLFSLLSATLRVTERTLPGNGHCWLEQPWSLHCPRGSPGIHCTIKRCTAVHKHTHTHTHTYCGSSNLSACRGELQRASSPEQRGYWPLARAHTHTPCRNTANVCITQLYAHRVSLPSTENILFLSPRHKYVLVHTSGAQLEFYVSWCRSMKGHRIQSHSGLSGHSELCVEDRATWQWCWYFLLAGPKGKCVLSLVVSALCTHSVLSFYIQTDLVSIPTHGN